MDQRGDKASMLNQLSSLQWPWLVAVVLISLATNVVAYSRFFLIARGAANVRIRYWSGLKVNAAATFLGFWTPISISGDVGRVYWLRKNVVESYWDAFLIVLWDRLIALAALVVCMLPFIPLYMGRIAEYFQVDTGLVKLASGDRFLLCSDGLHGYLRETDIAPIVGLAGEDAVKKFIALANERGGKDNITAILVEID